MRISRRLRIRLFVATALVAAATVPIVTVSAGGAGGSEPRQAAATGSGGYWMYAADGGIFSFGTANYQGAVHNQGSDIAGMAATPSGNGYWMADDDGDVFVAGDATVYGSRVSAADDVAAFAARPQGDGYWMATRTGAVENYGGAPAVPGTTVKLSHRIATLESTGSGAGAWMAGIDGGVFTFGDAGFFGSMGGKRLAQPIVDMAATPSGKGYWLVAADGGIFSFGDAAFYGSMGGTRLVAPVRGMLARPGTPELILGPADNAPPGTPGNNIPPGSTPGTPGTPSTPETRIVSGPVGLTNPGSFSFSFTSTLPGSTFACSVDGANGVPCSSPFAVNAGEGTHILSVRAAKAGVADPAPATWTWRVVPVATLVGAGDIAACAGAPSASGAAATAKLLDAIPDNPSTKVFTAGDNAYSNGSTSEFNNCYGPTWGSEKDRLRPAAGNHEYGTAGAAGYFNYFGSVVGQPGQGWYSYDLGAWHVVVLNSNCSSVGGCEVGSAQEQWLRADLAASAARCTVAVWHHPRFNSGSGHGNNTEVGPLWNALYSFGAELIVNGHEHLYERFAPQRPDASADPNFGIREIIAGTGGNSLYQFGSPQPNSQVRNNATTGVLKLTLRADSYDFNFIPVAGKTFTDSGSAACHDRP